MFQKTKKWLFIIIVFDKTKPYIFKVLSDVFPHQELFVFYKLLTYTNFLSIMINLYLKTLIKTYN